MEPNIPTPAEERAAIERVIDNYLSLLSRANSKAKIEMGFIEGTQHGRDIDTIIAARATRVEPDPLPNVDFSSRVPVELEKAKAACAKGKHWLGMLPDLTPATVCAWDFCSFGKENG